MATHAQNETIFGFPVVIDERVPEDCVVVFDGPLIQSTHNLKTGESRRYSHEYWRGVAERALANSLLSPAEMLKKFNGDPV